MPKRFSKEEVLKKNNEGTWLSPIPQPFAQGCESLPPEDPKYRKFLGSVAIGLGTICDENDRFSRTPPKDIKDKFQILPKDVLSSTPLSPTHEISNKEIQLEFGEFVDAARFRWHEKLSLLGMEEAIYAVQVRVHSKLEVYHDYARPTYSINLKSYGGKFFSLRLLSLVNTEWHFAERAVREYSKQIDFNGGLLVKDSLNRVWVDEQVIRRAAFHYSRYQIERTAQKKDLVVDDKLRFAHFIVFRSHLPKLSYNVNGWVLPELDSDTAREAA
mgnify:CR=1 FL=1